MSDKYAQLDDVLVELIFKGRKSLGELCLEKNSVWPLVEPHRSKNPWRGGLTPVSIIVEKRLQEIRKQGRIFFDGKGWLPNIAVDSK
jgi:hypothetical protein